jgi:adenylate kinase
MIVVVTGMVGVDKKRYIANVCEYAAKRGTAIEVCNVGNAMYAEARDITAGKILDIPMRRLSSIRRSVFKDIIARSKKAENLIVNTHATFRWRHGLFPAVDFDQMRELDADMYINLIDGVVSLHARLSSGHNIEHTLKDLTVWREEEILGTEMLCKGIDPERPMYCLARGAEEETCEVFYRLAFEQERKRAYLSFPMTHVADMEDVRRDIGTFRDELKKQLICFDPADLEESYLPLYAEQAAEAGEKSVEMSVLGRKIRIELEQIKQIESDISSQIYARDFLLIDQADMIISYVPKLADGRAALSSGVERELQHAHEAAKEVYVIWCSEYNPSVFVTQTATKVFKSVTELQDYFKQKGYIDK